MKDVWKEHEPNLGFKMINRKKIVEFLLSFKTIECLKYS